MRRRRVATVVATAFATLVITATASVAGVQQPAPRLLNGFGDAASRTSAIERAIVDSASTATGGGHWSVTASGEIHTSGDAVHLGSLVGVDLDAPVVAITGTATGSGYWLTSADGGVFAFGDARFHGSLGAIDLDRPIVDIAAHPTGGGYWLVASDGGVFAFGDAPFRGSLGGVRLAQDVVGIAAEPSGQGYWLVGADGGVFAFGDARFSGSLGAITLDRPIVDIAAHPTGGGYWLAGADGGVFAFGASAYQGSLSRVADDIPITSITATPSGNGYWLTSSMVSNGDPPYDGVTSAERVLTAVHTFGTAIAPKSVVHNGDGLFIANNMMYRHTMTIYDRSFQLVASISDSVVLSDFGIASARPGTSYAGSPVEAAFTSDGEHAYVSNYMMFGPGYFRAGRDGCGRGIWDESFLYRISMETFSIDQVIPVGAVPKFVAVSPDDRYVMVTNWCGFDLSVINTSTATEVARIDLGRHPRGIAVTSDSRTAYVAVMGSRDIAVVDLHDLGAPVGWIRNVGANPRHLVLSPDDQTLYASLNGEGRLAKIDLSTGIVISKAVTGNAPRSMVLADDGEALYVVNYRSNTLSKVRTSDLVEIQELRTGPRPIGITYDRTTRRVWVSNYSGSITVFQDAAAR